MPWGRLILAALATLLVVGAMAGLIAAGMGLWRPDFSAPGVDARDVAALNQPFDDVRLGRDSELIARLPSEIPREQAQAEIDRIQGLLPAGEPASSRTTFLSSTIGTAGARLQAIREYEYPQQVVRTETILYRRDSGDAWGVEGFHLNVATREELAANEVRLLEEPPLVQAAVAGAFAVPLFILATFLAALFWRGLRLRWIWLIIIVVGLTTLRVSPATDQFEFTPISFQLFGASATWSGSAFDSWVIGVSAPLGALVFWLTRLFQRQAEPAG